MIEYVSGDFFDYEADIRINTVNCVGVMGKGVALEFKKRYPDMFKEYVAVCHRHEIAPGMPHVWEEYDLFTKCTIVNLPTKIHWKNPSKYEYIERDLIWLKDFLAEKDKSVTVTLPALGCGHGGLNWDIVRGQILHYLGNVPAKILVFEPASSNKQLEDWSSNSRLTEAKIEILYPSDPKYPKGNFGFTIDHIFCKGNTDILTYKRISLIFKNNFSEKESSAIFQTLAELSPSNLSIVMGLSNKQHVVLARELMHQGYALLLVIPYGILNFKYDSALQEYEGNYVILSYTMPRQEYKKYEYINSLKYRNAIANAILYADADRADISKIYKHIQKNNNVFYINFWTEIIDEFVNIGAKKIGINSTTHKPNVELLEQCLWSDNSQNP